MATLDPLRNDSSEEMGLGAADLGDVYVIRVRLDSGAIIQPCYIPFSESANGECSAEAVAYYNHFYAGEGRVANIALEASLRDAGVLDPGSIERWADVKERLNRDFLSDLKEKGVSADILGEISRNINIDKNRENFQKILEFTPYTQADKGMIDKALVTATRAHRPATAARPQDEEGLFHVPYINHPINVATAAVKAGLSANAVTAALLHDVLEDTSLTLEDLSAEFNDSVVSMVTSLTKQKGQSRKDFMEHVAALTGEEQAIKGLDRLDNLLRSFGIVDKKYIERMLSEDLAVYHHIFETNTHLVPVKSLYFDLHNETAKLWQITA